MMCSLQYRGCLFNLIMLLSNIVLALMSQDIPVNRLHFTSETTSSAGIAQKTSFNKVVASPVKESRLQKGLADHDGGASGEYNTHLDVCHESTGNELSSRELQTGRIRRTPKHLFFDDEEIASLTQVALEQCPYNNFCRGNKTQSREFRAGFGSCCSDCYCDEQCGNRNDCRWDFLNNVKVEENNNLTCVTPVILEDNEQQLTKNDHGYLMIDSCRGNPSNECRKETGSIMGPFFPTYSQATSMIYYNSVCARCNGETDSIPFDMYVSCNDVTSPDGISFISRLKRKQCKMWFQPPKKANVDRFVCYKEPTRTCNMTDGPMRNIINFEKACQLTNAYVTRRNPGGRGTVIYANIFCTLCDVHDHNPFGLCRMAYDIPRSSSKLTTLINYKVISDSLTNEQSDTRGTSVEKQKHVSCRDDEVKQPIKEVCRQLLCPNGAIRTPNGCKLFAKTWYVSGYEIHVIMTPTSERLIPLTEFNEHTQNEEDINNWLDTKGLDINHMIMYAEETVVNNITFLKRINMKLGSNMYPLNAPQLLKAIERSLLTQWVITINESAYTYTIGFDKYETLVENGKVARMGWVGTDSDTSHEPFLLPKSYTMILSRAKLVGLHINKMYFCEKIELQEEEWIGGFYGIWLNVTGAGNDTFLGDAEYSDEQDLYGIRVQICLDDFLSQFVSEVNRAHLLRYTIYLVIFLTYSSIFVLV